MALIAQMTKHSLAPKGRKSKKSKRTPETEIEDTAEGEEGKDENEEQPIPKQQQEKHSAARTKHVQPNYLCCICCMCAPIDHAWTDDSLDL